MPNESNGILASFAGLLDDWSRTGLEKVFIGNCP